MSFTFTLLDKGISFRLSLFKCLCYTFLKWGFSTDASCYCSSLIWCVVHLNILSFNVSGTLDPSSPQILHCCCWLSSSYACNTVKTSRVGVLLGPSVTSWKQMSPGCFTWVRVSLYCSFYPSATLNVSCRRTCPSQKNGMSSTNCSW